MTHTLQSIDVEPRFENAFAVVACPDPDCSRPALVDDRWTLPSTDGPFEMVKIRCAAGCWYTVPAGELQAL
jgi:hypothetical protein